MSCCALAALCWMGSASRLPAQTAAPSALPLAVDSADRFQAESNLQAARAQLAVAENALATTRKSVDQGHLPSSEIIRAEAELQKWRGVVASVERDQARHTLYQRLGRPVDVKLRDATLPQSAQVIAQASGLSITVDPALGQSGRITTTATGVPTAEVLRLLAVNTNAQVAPLPDASGVLLRPVPTLEINGQTTQFPGPYAPWSAEWKELGGPPHSAGPFAVEPFVRPQAGVAGGPDGPFAGPRPVTPAPGNPRNFFGGPGATPARPDQPGMPGGFFTPGPAFAPGGIGSYYSQDTPVSITAVGSNRFIVATRVRTGGPVIGGPNGPMVSTALVLTLYEIDGSRMRRLSSTVYEPGPLPNAPMPANAPGFFRPGAPPAPAAPFLAPGQPAQPRPAQPGYFDPNRRPVPQPAPQPPRAPEPQPDPSR